MSRASSRGAAGVICLLLCALAHANDSPLRSISVPGQPGPHPAVLLLHGCSGIESNVPMWQDFLRSKGYASAAVESFQRRGFSEICTDFSRVPMAVRLNDVYQGLAELAARPDIDPQRIAVMGFSNGAVAVLSALTTTIAAQLPSAHARFRAGIALYPDCSLHSPHAFAAPILTLVGREDDWTPAAECESLARKVPASRPPFEVTVYPGAHHSFDMPGLNRQYLGRVRNIHKATGMGATVAGDGTARQQAMRDVDQYLGRVLVARPK